MNTRKFKDIVARKVMFLLCMFILSLTFLIIFGLYQRSRPILAIKSLKDLLFSATWHPAQGQFGLAGFIAGTLWVVAIAMIIAVPLSILTSIYLSEYSHRRVREFIRPMIDLLAGISPVIHGVWGVVAIVPFVRDYLTPFLSEKVPFFPFISDNHTGFSAITGGIVLAIMACPIMISIISEVIRTVPFGVRKSSLAPGATKWQTVKYVILRKA